MDATPTNSCNYTDRQWVYLLKLRETARTSEDKKAAEAVINCLWEKLFTFCVNRAVHYRQSPDFAQDAATKSFFRILKAVDKGKYREEGPFVSYCYVVAARQILSMLPAQIRDERRRAELPDDREWEPPKQLLDRDKVRQLLKPCINQLPPNAREAFLLRYPWVADDEARKTLLHRYPSMADEEEVEEHTPAEVAVILTRALGRPFEANAVNQAARNARLGVKRCLEGRGFSGVQAVLDDIS